MAGLWSGQKRSRMKLVPYKKSGDSTESAISSIPIETKTPHDSDLGGGCYG